MRPATTQWFRGGAGRRIAVVAVAGAMVAGLALPVAGRLAADPGGGVRPRAASAAEPDLPVVFEPNVGQARPGIGFLARGSGLSLALSPTEARFSVGAAGDDTAPAAPASLRLEGADAGAAMVPAGPQRATTNYFIGNDAAKWHRNVPTYAKVVSRGVYPGVDLAWYGAGKSGAGLEYDFVVAPGADPGPIAMTVGGAEALELDAGGDLVARLAGGHTLRQHRPVAYQADGAGKRTPVEAAFRLDGDKVRFDLGAFDPGRELVIDPVLAWSTFLGGSGHDFGNAIDLDAEGNVFVAGNTASADFFTTDGSIHNNPNGSTDIFITKFDPSGALLYSTLVGGAYFDDANGALNVGNALVVSPAGFVHVVGQTGSPDFPQVNAQDSCPPVIDSIKGRDAFAFKLDPVGSTLTYSTCLGGPKNDFAGGGALDSLGNLYVAGGTDSKKFPTRNNAQMGIGGKCLAHAGDPDVVEQRDAFVTKLGPKGAMQYSTCWGGIFFDEARGVDVDAAGNAYVVGVTRSSSFPQKNNAGVQTGLSAGDGTGFVLKVSPVPSAKFSTFLGGNDITQVQSVVVRDGLVYLAGSTLADDLSTKWPAATAGAYQPANAGGGGDAFVARLRFEPGAPHAPVMDRLTYLGGSGRDVLQDLALGAGGAWVVVDNQSNDFPQVDALQACNDGNSVVARLDEALTTLMFSSCLGGNNGNSEDVRGLAVDAVGNAHVTGFTLSSDFPTTPGAHDPTCGTDGTCNGGSRVDAYVVKISP